MLCISVVFAVAWCPSVCSSDTLVDCIQAKDIVKLLSMPGSPIILVFLTPSPVTQFQGEPLQQERKIRGLGNFFFDFRLKSPSVSETVRDRPMVTMKR